VSQNRARARYTRKQINFALVTVSLQIIGATWVALNVGRAAVAFLVYVVR
jgi:hypothetical protein